MVGLVVTGKQFEESWQTVRLCTELTESDLSRVILALHTPGYVPGCDC